MYQILRPTLLCLSLSWCVQSYGQSETPPEWPDPPVKLMILGTFHFKDKGLDSYRPKYDIDILSPKRQSEVEELVRLISSFRPNKVAVERLVSDQADVDSMYRLYLSGNLPPSSNEIVQVAFRLASKLHHNRVYAVDAKRRFYSPWVDPDEYAEIHQQEDRLDRDLFELYKRQHEVDDMLKSRMTLIEYLLYLNTSEHVRRAHGQYVIGSFEVGTQDEYPGVDSRTAWYNRNLRIFANLQRIADMNGDRILLLIGAGHIPIIQQAAEASPQFEVIRVSDFLKVK